MLGKRKRSTQVLDRSPENVVGKHSPSEISSERTRTASHSPAAMASQDRFKEYFESRFEPLEGVGGVGNRDRDGGGLDDDDDDDDDGFSEDEDDEEGWEGLSGGESEPESESDSSLDSDVEARQ